MLKKMMRIEAVELLKRTNMVLNDDCEIDVKIVYAMSKTKSKLRDIALEYEEMVTSLNKELRKISIIETSDRERKEKKEVIENQLNEYIKEIVEIDVYGIDTDVVPKKGKASLLGTLFYYVKEE